MCGHVDIAIVLSQEFVALGDARGDDSVKHAMDAQHPDQCCALIYTSGTTGAPKGVMLSHDNITWTAKAVLDLFNADENDPLVSYLPLSHVAAAMIDMYGAFRVLYGARGDTTRSHRARARHQVLRLLETRYHLPSLMP